MADEEAGQVTTNPEIEQEARQLGWVPKSEFRGGEDKWVDAEAFIDRGRQILPILQKNNERLQRQIQEKDARLAKLEETVAASQESMKALEEHYTAANKRQVQEARQKLLEELQSAKKAGDTEAEVQITDELVQMSAALKEEPKKEVKQETKTETVQKGDLPEVVEFKSNNSWYGTDLKKTVQFNRIAEDLRMEGNTLVGKPFLDAVLREFDKANKSTNTKVEAGRSNGGGGSTSNGSRFADLPPEAKQACRDDAKRLVGEGRRFKTMAEWENRYAQIYFGAEQ